jgi:hypothetical protein
LVSSELAWLAPPVKFCFLATTWGFDLSVFGLSVFGRSVVDAWGFDLSVFGWSVFDAWGFDLSVFGWSVFDACGFDLSVFGWSVFDACGFDLSVFGWSVFDACGFDPSVFAPSDFVVFDWPLFFPPLSPEPCSLPPFCGLEIEAAGRTVDADAGVARNIAPIHNTNVVTISPSRYRRTVSTLSANEDRNCTATTSAHAAWLSATSSREGVPYMDRS